MHSDLTGYIDVAQVTLYAFWIFFACLIFYLRREDKREGYPLQYEEDRGRSSVGFPAYPGLKKYLLRRGHVATLPNWKNDRRDAAVTPMAPWPGSPYVPTGNPMLDGVGPASFADREDVPELTMDYIPAIVPLRADATITLEPRDPDPRGMPVMGADGETGGTICDVWVDRAEMLIRYLEVEVAGAAGRRVLLPMTMALIKRRWKQSYVQVQSILGSQFADAPVLTSPDQVTKREEDRIVGYFGGGNLYATPARQEPLL
jgi:photosynthetic reaction center H subunit